MHAKLVFVCLSIAVAADAMAADANPPAADKPIATRRVIAPTISETRATRMPDGSLAITCTDRPNPKAHASLQQTRSPQLDPDQQP